MSDNAIIADAERARLTGKPGAHSAYLEDGVLVVEWYDFGDGAPYESANMLRFDVAAQAKLADLLRPDAPPAASGLPAVIADRFASYFEVRDFAETHGVAFTKSVAFMP